MIAQHLGHVVFYVRDLNRSLTFYRDLLRFDEVGKIGDHVSALTSGRTHHEILLIEVEAILNRIIVHTPCQLTCLYQLVSFQSMPVGN